MKLSARIIAMLALTAITGAQAVQAADAPAKEAKPAKLNPRQKARFEGVTGKPLTPEQVQALAEAEAEYLAAQKELLAKLRAKQAATLGITVEKLAEYDAAARKKALSERKEQETPAAEAK